MIPFIDSPDIGQPSQLFLRNIIATVFDVTIIAWGQVLAGGEVNSSSSEPDIAGRLASRMVAEKERRSLQIRIDEEVGTRSSHDIPKPDGRIDIRITYNFNESEYFGMECKRVGGKDKRLAKDYLSKGILSFVTGKYSLGHTWAAMLGFVIDGDVAGSVKLICDCLSTNRRECAIKSDWSREIGFGPHQDLYCTQHYQQSRNSEITIFHLLLSIDGLANIKREPHGKKKSGSPKRRVI